VFNCNGAFLTPYQTGMNTQPLYRWITIIVLVLLVVAGMTLKQKNSSLTTKNNILVLQNDSILSVNQQLAKELSKLQRLLDSVGIKSNARLSN
jgi:hypothetical protein